MACQGVEEAYLVSYRKVSRSFLGEYERKMRDWCHRSYTQAGSKKQSLLSHGLRKRLATLGEPSGAVGDALRPLVDECLRRNAT